MASKRAIVGLGFDDSKQESMDATFEATFFAFPPSGEGGNDEGANALSLRPHPMVAGMLPN